MEVMFSVEKLGKRRKSHFQPDTESPWPWLWSVPLGISPGLCIWGCEVPVNGTIFTVEENKVAFREHRWAGLAGWG